MGRTARGLRIRIGGEQGQIAMQVGTSAKVVQI